MLQFNFVACSTVIHHSKVEFCSFGKAFVQFYTYFIREKRQLRNVIIAEYGFFKMYYISRI